MRTLTVIRQHPHIGPSTLTYLFEGQIQHKDSLGSDQLVSPGDVSWMSAGTAIAHIERTPTPLLEQGSALHGLQVWLADRFRRNRPDRTALKTEPHNTIAATQPKASNGRL